MTGKGKVRDQDQEPPPPPELSFVHLLQPNNRDLAANWAVDVGRELDNYLAQLSVTAFFQDGTTSLNFAQAALLIQGSIRIFSRKVEYLYALVLQALEFIAQKKQAQQEKSSIQADGKDADIIEEDEEEFLNLDDVQEETNIDIDDEGHEATLTSAAKPPASLLVLEGETVDIGGDGGELAAYQIATSSLHRDFLLLDPCDADAVDKYLNVNKVAANGTPNHLSNSARHRTPRTPNLGFDEDTFGGHASVEDDFEDDEDDPWKPLNPHEPGDLPVKPYRRGEASEGYDYLRNRRSGMLIRLQLRFALEFPLARRFGTICPKFTRVSKTGDCNINGKKILHSPPIYEKLRSSMTLNQSSSFDGPGAPSDDDQGIGVEHDFEDIDMFDDYFGESNNSISIAENPMLPERAL